MISLAASEEYGNLSSEFTADMLYESIKRLGETGSERCSRCKSPVLTHEVTTIDGKPYCKSCGSQMAGSPSWQDLALLAQVAIDEERVAIEQKRQQIIDAGAENGITISTDNALKHVEHLKLCYEGSDPEYAKQIDQFCKEFREAHGARIPVDTAYGLLKEIENKFGKE